MLHHRRKSQNKTQETDALLAACMPVTGIGEVSQ